MFSTLSTNATSVAFSFSVSQWFVATFWLAAPVYEDLGLSYRVMGELQGVKPAGVGKSIVSTPDSMHLGYEQGGCPK